MSCSTDESPNKTAPEVKTQNWLKTTLVESTPRVIEDMRLDSLFIHGSINWIIQSIVYCHIIASVAKLELRCHDRKRRQQVWQNRPIKSDSCLEQCNAPTGLSIHMPQALITRNCPIVMSAAVCKPVPTRRQVYQSMSPTDIEVVPLNSAASRLITILICCLTSNRIIDSRLVLSATGQEEYGPTTTIDQYDLPSLRHRTGPWENNRER